LCCIIGPSRHERFAQDILGEWSDRVREEPNYDKVPQILGEPPLVDENGLLHLPWPGHIGTDRLVPFDLLLATATHPNLGDPPAYPTPKMIAQAWGEDRDDHIEYFRQNRANRISTFQDETLLEELRTNFPGKLVGLK
jgi:hypothetical protein